MRKVHVNKLHTTHNILEKLHKYHYKEKKYTYLYSENGIFCMENDQIYKLNIVDGEIEKKNDYYENFDLWIDSSNIIKEKDLQQIPSNYYLQKIKELHFRLHENATMTFCIELSDNKISNYYFLTDENIDNYSIKKDIVTFLSVLK